MIRGAHVSVAYIVTSSDLSVSVYTRCPLTVVTGPLTTFSDSGTFEDEDVIWFTSHIPADEENCDPASGGSFTYLPTNEFGKEDDPAVDFQNAASPFIHIDLPIAIIVMLPFDPVPIVMAQPLPLTPMLTVVALPLSEMVPVMVKPGADFRSLIALVAICFAVMPARGSGCLAVVPVRAPCPAQPAADRHSAAAAVTPSTAFAVNDIDERPILVGVTVQR